MPKLVRKLSRESREALRKAGRKGGSAKVPKGFSKMDKERYAEISAKRKANNAKSQSA